MAIQLGHIKPYPKKLEKELASMIDRAGCAAQVVKPGLFITRSVSEGFLAFPSLTLRVMKNTLLFDDITQLLAPQHFTPVISNLMNNPG